MVEVDGQGSQQNEANRADDKSTRRKSLGAKSIGKIAADGSGCKKSDDLQQCVEASDKRCILVRYAMQRQKDALKPNDEHKAEPTARQSSRKQRDIAKCKCPDAEQTEVKQRLFDALLDDSKDNQHGETDGQAGKDKRRAPAHRMTTVGHDAVCEPKHDAKDAKRKGQVPCHVQMFTPLWRGDFTQRDISPDGSCDTDGDVDQKHVSPVTCRRQKSTDDQPYDTAGHRCNLVESKCQAPLIGWKRIRQNRGAVREQKRPANTLNDAEYNQFDLPGHALTPRESTEYGADGENQEP